MSAKPAAEHAVDHDAAMLLAIELFSRFFRLYLPLPARLSG